MLDLAAVLDRREWRELLGVNEKAPETNVRVGDYEVDFVWRREGVVVEVDGYTVHTMRRKFENDRRRDALLVARGVRVMRVTWQQLSDEPEAMLVRLEQTLIRA